MKISQLIELFQEWAPLQYQESYDNSGLQVGQLDDEIKGALLTLDVTEEVLEEAIQKSCNLIIAHHPVIFGGLKSITGKNYVQRIIRKAIKNDVNIVAMHTNVDNIYEGVNAKIAEQLGLNNLRILSPSSNSLLKLQTYVPVSAAPVVQSALFAAGAGHIGAYDECSFMQLGTGSFRPSITAQPFIGIAGGAQEQVEEMKIEVLVPTHLRNKVQSALLAAHPYEEVAFDWISLSNYNTALGAGMIGHLETPMAALDFLKSLKTKMKASVVRHTRILDKPIQTVAVCGGSGSFLLSAAIAAKADIFVSADFKYHQFFDAEDKLIIADIGHFESEQYTVELFGDLLKKKNVTFAVVLSSTDTNPIKYL